jgi:protein-L-isoaspartate(D-aspartate) O-methyltransferase
MGACPYAMEKRQLMDYWKSTGLVSDEKILRAFDDVPRNLFIRKGQEAEAFADYPLPIGAGQTISQPTTVMLMTQALELKENHNVLEVGSGSGWQAAIIAKLVKTVITTEIIPELADFARSNLKRAGIKNVEVITADGSNGYLPGSPYDRILITAACPRIPEPLLNQLKTEGIIMAPVGSLTFGQEMVKIRKTQRGLETENLGSFVFVPLKGEYGF